jgi:hypothetical protein
MLTPWGKSDSMQRIQRGLSFVGTPSHGGFMVSDGVARKQLSSAALLRGQRCGNYYAFEEDCDAYIVLLEIPASRQGTLTDEKKIIEGLSRWHADYLIERGIEPDAEGLKFFNENRLHDRMRADKSPDLIVSASGSWAQWVPEGCVGVTTADGSRWLVRSDEYEKRNTNLTLLSHFKLVKAVS